MGFCFAEIVTQRNFDEFSGAPVAVLWVKRRAIALHFPSMISRYFFDGYEEARVGSFDKAQIATPVWLMDRLYRAPLSAQWPGRQGAEEVPDGFYLLKDGKPIAFHDGVWKPATQPGTDLLSVFAAVAGRSAERDARAVIDHFVAALAPRPKKTTKAQARSAPSQPSGTAAPPSRDPFAVLKIPKTASLAEIKKARDQRLHENHPDRVAGMSEEIRRLAHEMTLEVNAAYAAITKPGRAR